MNKFPFQLSIRCNDQEKHSESVTCTALLRCVPGRRNVFDATWNNRNVIVKVFNHKLKAKFHVRREWKGIAELSERKINSPTLLFGGQTEENDWAVVTEKIQSSSTVLKIFNSYQSNEKKLELLMMVCRELGFQHNAGVLQKDFHLDNFLIANNKIYSLDPAQIKFSRRPLSKKKSISNLAMLMLYLPVDDKESQNVLSREYFRLRDWQFSPQQEQAIQKQINIQKKRSIERGLKKTLRTSKRFIRIKNNYITAVFDKTFSENSDIVEFINQIDSLMTNGHVLKNGDTSFVSKNIWAKKNIVIKRYNHKGFIHSLRHTIIGSRARRSWLCAQRLAILEIPTPKPLAFIERRKGCIVWNSYLVTEYVEGTNLYYVLNDNSFYDSKRNSAKKEVEKLLDKLGKSHITHGDLKHSNILITQDGPVLTDLDAMQVHKSVFLYKLKRAKDIERFNRSK